MQQEIKQELNGSKSRYEKGLELYKQGKVSISSNGLFKVCGYYEVDTEKMVCSCPDYKTRKQSCKYYYAACLFQKNGGKQTIEHLEGYGNGSTSKNEQDLKVHDVVKIVPNKHKNDSGRDFDRNRPQLYQACGSQHCCRDSKDA